MLPYLFLKYQLTKHTNAFIKFLFRPRKIDKFREKMLNHKKKITIVKTKLWRCNFFGTRISFVFVSFCFLRLFKKKSIIQPETAVQLS